MFYPEETVQSQYAASPTIRALVDGLNGLIDPRADIQLFYDRIFNPQTAEGVGLQIWARIVGLQKTGLNVSAELPFGFFQYIKTDQDEIIPEVPQTEENFNRGPFYSVALSGSGYAELEANALRWLIFWKAQANVSGATAYELNKLLVEFVRFMRGPDAGNATFVEDTGVMQLTAYLGFQPTVFEKNILEQFGLFNRPAGVGIGLYPFKINAPVFGFVEDAEQTGIFGVAPFFNLNNS